MLSITVQLINVIEIVQKSEIRFVCLQMQLNGNISYGWLATDVTIAHDKDFLISSSQQQLFIVGIVTEILNA